MRKLVVCNIVSVDGFFSGLEGDLSVMPFGEGFSEYNAERLGAADTLLLGRKTFEAFRAYWPAVAGDERQPPLEREIARLSTEIDKVVVSDSLSPDAVGGWGPVRVVRQSDAHSEIASLKEKPGREILVFGSRVLWNDLLAAGLVDELHLLVGAGIVGEGVRAFAEKPPGSLRLLETRTFTPSSLVLVRYAIDR